KREKRRSPAASHGRFHSFPLLSIHSLLPLYRPGGRPETAFLFVWCLIVRTFRQNKPPMAPRRRRREPPAKTARLQRGRVFTWLFNRHPPIQAPASGPLSRARAIRQAKRRLSPAAAGGTPSGRERWGSRPASTYPFR